MRPCWPIVLGIVFGAVIAARPAIAAERVKLILDTDVGDDIDDAFAVIVALNSPEVELLGITTATRDTTRRAQIAAKLARLAGRPDLPVAPGPRTPGPVGRQAEWASHEPPPAAGPDAIDFIIATVHRHPGQVVLCVIGPETNIGRALARDPGLARLVKAIVVMGGDTGPRAEWNIRQDIPAARRVFASGAPLAMVGLNLTLQTRIDRAAQARIWAHPAPLAQAAHDLTRLWSGGKPADPIPHDLLALQYALGKDFVRFERRHVEVDDQGRTQITPGPANVAVGVAFTRGRQSIAAFTRWIVDRVIGR